MTSKALWLPLLWVIILGTRPVSLWLGMDAKLIDSASTEGNPVNRYLSLAMIAAGIVVLLRRRLDWQKIFASNRWLFAFFIYCGLSAIWSDYGFVSFKRWVRDSGNAIMVLIVLSEKKPFESIKAIFARYTRIAIPLSVLFIKYFPDLGRYYTRWTHEPAYCGVATFKNELGCILFICGCFLVQEYIDARSDQNVQRNKIDRWNRVLLILMVVWLLHMAHSSTALVCLIIGTGILLVMQFSWGRRQVEYLGSYSLAVGLMAGILMSTPGLLGDGLKILGRDSTLTGRTDIWADVLGEPINPLIGTGYQSFWLGPATDRLHLTQAHNGYLETYLNGGLIGLGILLAFLLSAARRIKRRVQKGGPNGALLLCFFVTGFCYNFTEAMFSGLSLVWFVLLIVTVEWQDITGIEVA